MVVGASPFCEMPSEPGIGEDGLVFAARDAYAVSTWHTLVITQRYVRTYFEATPLEQALTRALVARVKANLDATLDPRPDGYNVGFDAALGRDGRRGRAR